MCQWEILQGQAQGQTDLHVSTCFRPALGLQGTRQQRLHPTWRWGRLGGKVQGTPGAPKSLTTTVA